MKICFTGKRKIDNTIDFLNNEIWKNKCIEIYEYLYDLINNNPKEEYHFISGGALGTDLMCFVTIEVIKDMYPNFKITNELAIPYSGHESKWSEEWKSKLDKCKRVANIITNVETIDNYKSNNVYQKLQKRNEYMIDESDLVIALWDNIEKGGTWNAIKYANSKNKELKIFETNK